MSTVEEQLDRAAVADAVKRVVIAESRLSLSPADITEDEPLVGDLLRVNSLGFVGMLVRIEDELDVVLPDDLFVGRSFRTVADLVDVVRSGAVVSR
ncbi:acyl carrier protein [Streptomyces xinghaiensis]|uniref:acyl carrier protein n=1 Tax=Streptomyces xinghaiensis TaxID=1038928 RepID=UPI0005941B00|nr:acyl carrier protein [Streptomyces xinghaiensis]MZE79641.1 acyl carrier protein [Streptomyces sp. SID5475]